MAELEVSFDVQSPSIDATFDLSQPSLEAVFEINTLVTPVALGELTDVTITNPENGQTLVYNATTQMWNNSSANEAVWGNITGTLSDQTDLQNALNNKVTGNVPIAAKTATKITYDSKGLITGGTNLTAGDIPNLTLSKITDVTASASEVNVLDGVAITTTELNQLSGAAGNIQVQLNTEKANRISADNTLQANINAEASTRATADTAEANARIAEDIALSNRINAEASTRATVDTVLGERIDAEVSTRTTTDTALSNRITAEASTRATADIALGERIDEEVSTRTTEDTSLSDRINAEASTRATADTVEASTRATADTALGERIDEEISTRTTQDTALSDRIDSEASTRATEYTSLSDRITAEVSTRTTQDTALSDRINTEASTRATADTSLSDRITTNASSIATINTTISGYGDIVTHDQDEFATAAQGALADTALQPEDVIDNVVTTSTDLPLSANMGKELQDEIDNLKARGRFLALWNCATGLAESDPTTSPRPYNSGDYFIVGTIAAEGSTNYRPDGTQYVIGQASTTIETAVVQVDDVYYYDGTTWKLQVNTRKTVTFAQIAGQPTDNTNLAAALNNKVTKNNDITGATHTKITYDSKGLVTGGSDLTLSDLGITATASEINVLDGITASTAELNYTDGVTSNIQTQLNSKAIDSDVVHIATIEDITGAKTFTSTPRIKLNTPNIWLIDADATKGTAPSSVNNAFFGTVYDKNGLTNTNKLAQIYTNYSTNGAFDLNIACFEPTANSTNSTTLKIGYNASKQAYTSVVTPTEDTTSSTQIDTVGARNTKLAGYVTKNNDITGATHAKITYDSKGLVTNGEDITISDVTDITATAGEINVLDGITVSTAELNYTDGVTSNIQAQLDNKLPSTTKYGADLSYSNSSLQLKDQDGNVLGNAVTIESSPAIDNTTITKNSSSQLQAVGLINLTATITELNYCDGVTSNIQTQLNSKQNTLSEGTGIDITNDTISITQASSTLGGVIADARSASTDTQEVKIDTATGKLYTAPQNYTLDSLSITSTNTDIRTLVQAVVAKNLPIGTIVTGSVQLTDAPADNMTDAMVTIVAYQLTEGSSTDTIYDITLNSRVESPYQWHAEYWVSHPTAGVNWAAAPLAFWNMPTASATYGASDGKIAQYIGPGDGVHITGKFYKCQEVTPVTTPATYEWVLIHAEPAATSSSLGIVQVDGTTISANNGIISADSLTGLTASTSELNTLDGITADVNELNVLDGITATTTELNYVDGVTSNVQTQCDNKLNKQQITNCILEDPQNIKLELSNGTLTLKAGSVICVPNGFESDGTTPKFTEVTISSDKTFTWGYTGTGAVFYDITNNTLALTNVASETVSTLPTPSTSYKIYYYTTGNKCYFDDNSSALTEISFPIGLFTASSGISSIDQTFQSVGYIGSTVFVRKGLKVLIPNGRNDDGSLKNIEATTTKVIARTFDSTETYEAVLGIDAWNTFSRLERVSYSYNESANYNLNGSNKWDCCLIAAFTETSGVISNFKPYTATNILKYSDSSQISGWGMLSSRFITLTLGASGSTYTAPANGWIVCNGVTSPSNGYLAITVDNIPVAQQSVSSETSKTFTVSFPIKKGNTYKVEYVNYTSNYFRFYYAEGEAGV